MRMYIIGYELHSYPIKGSYPIEVSNIEVEKKHKFTFYSTTNWLFAGKNISSYRGFFERDEKFVSISFKRIPGLFPYLGSGLVDGMIYPCENRVPIEPIGNVRNVIRLGTISFETYQFYQRQGL